MSHFYLFREELIERLQIQKLQKTYQRLQNHPQNKRIVRGRELQKLQKDPSDLGYLGVLPKNQNPFST
jgi:hypothetical protein